MTAPGEDLDAFRVLLRALVRHPWQIEQYIQAIHGWSMREHVDAAHPDQLERVADLSTAGKTPADSEAWLFGYRFRDTAALGGDGDGHAGSL